MYILYCNVIIICVLYRGINLIPINCNTISGFWILDSYSCGLFISQKINIILTVSQPYYNMVTFCLIFFSYVSFLMPCTNSIVITAQNQ